MPLTDEDKIKKRNREQTLEFWGSDKVLVNGSSYHGGKSIHIDLRCSHVKRMDKMNAVDEEMADEWYDRCSICHGDDSVRGDGTANGLSAVDIERMAKNGDIDV